MEFLNTAIFWIYFSISIISYFIMRFVQHGWGASKDKAEIIMGIIQLIVLILTFITVNWKAGLTLIISLLVLSLPIEYALYLIYRKLLPGSRFMSYRQFRKGLSPDVFRNESINSVINNPESSINDNYMLNDIREDLKTVQVLRKYNKTPDDLDHIFQLLKVGGDDLASEVINSPDLLSSYLEMKNNGEVDTVISFKLAKMLGKIP